MGACPPGALLSQSVERKLTSLVTQTVKNLPAVQETWVLSLGGEDPLEKAMATHSSILAWKIPMDRGAWQATAHGVTKSLTRLSDWHFHFHGKREQSFLNYAFISSLVYTPLLISLPETTVWGTEAGTKKEFMTNWCQWSTHSQGNGPRRGWARESFWSAKKFKYMLHLWERTDS